MFSRIALTLLLLTAAVGQTLPAAATPGAPPEIDQALRARVNEFFQYHVEGSAVSLRKAMEMVAEETKDEYFVAGKPQFLKFEVSAVEYNDEFTRARVSLEVTRNVVITAQLLEWTLPMRTTWKIESGKWVWYQDHNDLHSTPMSDTTGRPAGASEGAVPRLPDLTKPETLAALAKDIMRTSSLDKQNVTLRWGRASEDQVVFINEFPGAELVLAGVPEIPGLTVAIDKATLKVKENGLIRFRYAPPADFKSTEEAPKRFSMQVMVVPFDQVLRIDVDFVTP